MAGLIPRAFIDDLIARVDIVEIIRARIELKKAGGNHMACCPFHNEKTPSFSVNGAKQFYHCFGCGVSGNAISFVMEYDRLNFVEAVESLADGLGIDVPREGKDAAPREDHSSLYNALERCDGYYRKQLSQHEAAVSYLKKRGLDGETAQTFGLGYAPSGWDTLVKEGIPEQALDRAGMLSHGDKGRLYDRFRERVMFPIRDRRGRTIGFGGRVMGDDEPKYLNSPETPLFHKSNALYGIYEMLQAVRSPERIVIVEGYMDVVSLAQFDVRNCVATLGTATTSQHIEMLFKTARKICFCFDGDRAGRAAAWRALQNALPAMRDGCEVGFLLLADGVDPDSYVREHGKDAFEALVEQATPLSDFLFEQLTAPLDLSNIGDRAKLSTDALPLINNLPAGIYRTLMSDKLNALVGTTVRIDAPARTGHTRTVKNKKDESRMTPIRSTIAMLLQYPQLLQTHDPDDIECPAGSKGEATFYKLVSLILAEPECTTAQLLEHFRDQRGYSALMNLAAYRLPDGEEISEEIAANIINDNLKNLRREAAAAALKELLHGRTLSDLSAADKQHYLTLLTRSKS